MRPTAAIFCNESLTEIRERFYGSTQAAYSNLHLQIASDDPRILAWPWEALRNPELGWLAQTCQVERRLNEAYDPPPIPDSLPKDRINILLVMARPYERDVSSRTIARPLVELIGRGRVSASMEVLITFRNASPEEKHQLRAMWEQAGLGVPPEDEGNNNGRGQTPRLAENKQPQVLQLRPLRVLRSG